MNTKKNNIPYEDKLYQRLGYTFKNKGLIKQALTHCSAGSSNNERLEFLGDSVLSCVIANELYHRFPDASEGELSRLRAFLVKGDTLADIASELHLGDFIALGIGELKSGGHRRASILADALEAIIAAVFLDSDMSSAQTLIKKLYHQKLEDKQLRNNLKDPKTNLQEYLQANQGHLPQYQLTKTLGDDHTQVFFVTCQVNNIPFHTEGQGLTRRKAEQDAAKQFLYRLMEKN